MGKLILNPEYELFERGGHPFCSSRQVAETFERQHQHVLRSIREAGEEMGRFAVQFWTTNFIEVKYKERGRLYPEFLLTKDGFSFVAMGFTGGKAAQFKIAYINRFNHMEEFIKSLLAAKLEHPAFAEAVMLSHDEPKHYHFSNEADMINRIVLGVPAKGFRETHGIESGQSIRPFLSAGEIADIQRLQMADIGLLHAGIHFDQRKETLRGYLQKRRSRLALAA
jgi:Rha family phage regulatory protein